jgi:hypothetical protein
MWGSTAPAETDTITCNDCPACAGCAQAVRELRAVRCEDLPEQAPRGLRSYNPLRSRYAYSLQPGETFTTAELAARTHRNLASVRAWLFEATYAGIVQKIGATGRSHAAIWRFHPHHQLPSTLELQPSEYSRTPAFQETLP